MSDPVVQEVKSRLDIVPFIQRYVKLSRAGVNWKGVCPFHQEKTPSFMVSPTRQTWHCFGCSKGGDIFSFVMEFDRLEFPDALRMLAEQAGVQLVREDPRLRTERARMYSLVEEAAGFYETELKKIPAVLDYLRKRGLEGETIRNFRIGYAPASWDSTTRHLLSKGFTAEEAVAAGLSIKSEKRFNSHYDRFRNRIMFPLQDANGKTIGFSGRIFEQGIKTDEPKYVNSPQTLIYDKSRALYAFDKAKEAIRKKNRCVIVEGQMDVVMSHQAGVTETVAVSGTALTEKHLESLRRLADTLISSFDADQAGETATRRSLDLAAQFDFIRKVAIIPKGKDPADAVREDAAVWAKAVEDSASLMDFFWEKAVEKFALKTPEGKRDAGKYLLREVVKLSNEIERAHWVAKIAELLGVREDAVWSELKRYQQAGVDVIGQNGVDSPRLEKLKIQKLEERILGAAFLYREAREALKAEEAPLVFTMSSHGEIFKIIAASDAEAETDELLKLVPESLLSEANRLIFEVEALFQNIKDLRAELAACVREVKRERLRERLLKLAKSIGEAERGGDQEQRDALLIDFKTASESLQKLETPTA